MGQQRQGYSAYTATIRPQFTKFGPKFDYRGAHVRMTLGARTLLGEVTELYRDDICGTVRAKVTHFNGEPWAIDPTLAALYVLDRSAAE